MVIGKWKYDFATTIEKEKIENGNVSYVPVFYL